jgi:hypothetical protein
MAPKAALHQPERPLSGRQSGGDSKVHVKDTARFPGKWAFFEFEDSSPVKSSALPSPMPAIPVTPNVVPWIRRSRVQFYPVLRRRRGKGT